MKPRSHCRKARRDAARRRFVGALSTCVAFQCATAAEDAAGELPGEARPMEEIVIVASKTARPLHAVPAPVTVIDRERLNFEQVVEFADIARYEPAVETDFSSARFGNTGISIRGIGGNRVALEFDGVPLPQQFDVGNFADSSRLSMDPAVIQRIEIMRGPASVLYGSDAVGGVVAITSVDGRDLIDGGRRYYTGARSGYFGVNDSILGETTLAYAGAADSAVISLSHRDGDEPDNKARDVPDDEIDFRQWQAFGKWTHDFASGASLRVSLDYFERDTKSDLKSLPGFGRFGNTSSIRGDDDQRRDRVTVSFEIQDRGWLDHGSVMGYRQTNKTEQRTDEERTSQGTPVFLQRDFAMRELGYGGEVRTRWDFATGPFSHILIAGGEWDYQRLTETRDGSQMDLLTGTVTKTLLGEQFPLRDLPRSVTDEIGLYAQDEISFGPLTLVPAIRWDDFSLDAATDGIFTDSKRLTDLKSDNVTARVGATYQVTGDLNLYVHYTEGFRAPPAEDVNLFLDIPLFNVRALPNPDLEPETSQTIEGGFRFARRDTWLRAGTYRSNYDHFIESRANLGPDPVSGVLLFQSRNLDEASIYGVEAQLRQGLGVLHRSLNSMRLEAGFHWAHGNNEVSGEPLNDVSPLKAIFALRWDPADLPFSAAVNVTHLAKQTRVDFSDAVFFVPPAATVLDASLRWNPRSWIEVHAGVFNLTDKRYWRYADLRRLAPDDPRVEIASRPGIHAQFTVSLMY